MTKTINSYRRNSARNRPRDDQRTNSGPSSVRLEMQKVFSSLFARFMLLISSSPGRTVIYSTRINGCKTIAGTFLRPGNWHGRISASYPPPAGSVRWLWQYPQCGLLPEAAPVSGLYGPFPGWKTSGNRTCSKAPGKRKARLLAFV